MLVVKLTTRSRLQASLGATISDYKNQAFSILVIENGVAYIISIGRREYLLKIFIIDWLLQNKSEKT